MDINFISEIHIILIIAFIVYYYKVELLHSRSLKYKVPLQCIIEIDFEILHIQKLNIRV